MITLLEQEGKVTSTDSFETAVQKVSVKCNKDNRHLCNGTPRYMNKQRCVISWNIQQNELQEMQ